jgi:hypothetical protein
MTTHDLSSFYIANNRSVTKMSKSRFSGFFLVAVAFAVLFTCTNLSVAASNEPQPGEVYKEYSVALGGESWRVTDPNTTYGPPATDFLPNPILQFYGVDLTLATKAELVADKWGGHLGTMNKRLRFNGNDSIMVPELSTTPTNSQCYLQEPNVTIPIPISHLVAGTNNLQGSCDNQSCYYFNWGQWGWYALTLRVYYDVSKPHPTGAITSPATGSTFGDNPTITATASGGAGIEKVEFLGYYDGYDYDGDGVYKEWHSSYRRGIALDIANHIGTATVSPYSVTWNTEWIPDQTTGSVKIMARVKDNNGMWYVMPIADNLTFQRASGSVRMYKSFNVPENFWARQGLTNKFCNFKIPPTDSTAIWTAVRMCIPTWNGIDGEGDVHWYKVNDYTIPTNIGSNHQYKYDEVDLPTSSIKTGTNKFQAYATVTLHHGIELMWPGPGFLVKYQNTIPPPPAPSATIQSDEFNLPTLDLGVWDFVDYVGDASQGQTGTQLSLSVPSGTSHDLYTGQNHSPRVLQYITDIQNFEVEARFDGVMNTQYQMQGIIVEQDASNLLRFDYYSDGTNIIVNSLAIIGGSASGKISFIGAPAGLTPLYIRVQRDAANWTMRYSTDGSTWNLAGTYSQPLTATAIGVFAGNAGGAPPAFTGLVNYFRNLGAAPVQLASFTASRVNTNQIRLNWTTVSEVNNYGFEVEKSLGNTNNFTGISGSFIPGNGTTLEPHSYSFTDAIMSNGNWFYRLKQIDLDGTINYSDPVEINTLTSVNDKRVPTEFSLAQNYPNPFNPTTRIEYALPKESSVKLDVYNTLGQLITTLVNAKQSIGYHAVEFDASGLGSGIYFCKLTTEGISLTRKMMLVR